MCVPLKWPKLKEFPLQRWHLSCHQYEACTLPSVKKDVLPDGGKWVTFWLTNLKHLYQCWLQHPIHFYSPFLRHALSLHLEKRICPIFLSLPSNWQEIWYGSFWRAHLIIHAKNADSSGALMGTLSTWRKLIIILPFSHCFGDPYGLFSCGASQFESSDPGCLIWGCFLGRCRFISQIDFHIWGWST